MVLQRAFLFFVCFCCMYSVLSQNRNTIESALGNLEGITYKRMGPEDASVHVYELKIRQPIDHNDTLQGFFQQKVLLRHTGFDNPVLMSTQGYEMYAVSNELERIYNANHINIEHRFYGESVPVGKGFEYLTLEQATADLHAVNRLFKKLYKGTWISSGISKGGQLTLFYKYFYPDDVSVSIPYVAPVNNDLKDKRVFRFLDTVGTKECRSKIKEYQVYLLKNKSDILNRLKWYAKGARLAFDYLGSMEKAYEYAVLEYSFSFWQYGYSCNTIPELNNIDRVTEHFLSVSDIAFYSDKSIKKYAPHYYQSATQLGYYGYQIKPFRKYLDYFESDPSAVFVPKGLDASYSNELNKQLLKWLHTDGNNIIYIYGGNDTWSANMVEPSKKVNSKAFVIPDEDHFGARIKNMSPRKKKEVVELIEKWTGLRADLSKL